MTTKRSIKMAFGLHHLNSHFHPFFSSCFHKKKWQSTLLCSHNQSHFSFPLLPFLIWLLALFFTQKKRKNKLQLFLFSSKVDLALSFSFFKLPVFSSFSSPFSSSPKIQSFLSCLHGPFITEDWSELVVGRQAGTWRGNSEGAVGDSRWSTSQLGLARGSQGCSLVRGRANGLARG